MQSIFWQKEQSICLSQDFLKQSKPNETRLKACCAGNIFILSLFPYLDSSSFVGVWGCIVVKRSFRFRYFQNFIVSGKKSCDEENNGHRSSSLRWDFFLKKGCLIRWQSFRTVQETSDKHFSGHQAP